MHLKYIIKNYFYILFINFKLYLNNYLKNLEFIELIHNEIINMEIQLNKKEKENESNIITNNDNNINLKKIKNNIEVETLKSLIETKQIDIDEEENLKYLLSLTLKHKKPISNDLNLINLLNTYLNENNEQIFIDYTLQCCELGKEKILKIMFDKGININCQNEYGETPLHIAISKGDKKLISFLLQYNPNKNIKTFKDKMTAYDYSKEQGDQSIINLIEDNTKSLNCEDDNFNYNDNNISFDDRDNKVIGVFQSKKNDIIDNYNDINILFTKKSKFTNTINSTSNNGDIYYFDSVTEKDRYFEQIKRIENKSNYENEYIKEDIKNSIKKNNNNDNINNYINNNNNDNIDNYINNNNNEINDNYINNNNENIDNYIVNKEENDENNEKEKSNLEDSLDEENDFDINKNEKNKEEDKQRETNDCVSFIDELISKHKFYATEANHLIKQNKQSNLTNSHSNINSNRITSFTGNSLNNNIANKKNLLIPSNKNIRNNIPYNKIINNNYNEINEFKGPSKSYTNKNELNIDDSHEIKNKNNSQRVSFKYNKYLNNENLENKNLTKIKNFLSEIGLSYHYCNLLLSNGFDDLNVLIQQTKTGIAISDKNLKDIGFKSSGKRAKFLIHLEEKANLYEFEIDKEKVYFPSITNENKLYRLLSSINLEQYINNFIINDYTSPELLFIQMLSRQPLTDDILFNEIGIDKVGYRMRLINKLKNESNNFFYKMKKGILKNNNNLHIKKGSIILESQRGNNNEFCNMCKIF